MEKKSYHHGHLKVDLIEKSIEIVNREGVTHFSLRKVAAACGVSHAAPYNHFKNKEELLEATQEYITDQFSRSLEEVLEKCKDSKHLVRQLGITYVQFFVKNPQYFSFLYNQSNLQIDLSLNSGGGKSFKPFVIYKEIMQDTLDKIHYPKESQKDMIIALWAYVHGMAALSTMENVYFDEKWEEKVVDLIDLFKIDGI